VTVLLETEARAKIAPGRSNSSGPVGTLASELRVLRTDYASVVEPITSFIDELRAHDDKADRRVIPVSSRTACAIACSTIRSTSCSLRTTDPALTSWSHESVAAGGV